jgi:hypothetical protein
MWTSTSIIAKTITKVRAVLDGYCIQYKICVFSQGDYTDVAELDAPGAEFFLDAEPIWSMQEIIEADILIMAKSDFSYVAAFISEGIKIYETSFGQMIVGEAHEETKCGGDWDRGQENRCRDSLNLSPLWQPVSG